MSHLLSSSVVRLMATSSKRTSATCCMTQVCCSQSPCPCGRPLLTHASTGNTQTLKGRSGSVSVGSLLLSPGSWCTQGFVCPVHESVSLVLWKFCNQIPLAFKELWGVSVTLLDAQFGESVVGPRTFLTVGEFIWYNCSAVFGSSAPQLYGGVNGDLL